MTCFTIDITYESNSMLNYCCESKTICNIHGQGTVNTEITKYSKMTRTEDAVCQIWENNTKTL